MRDRGSRMGAPLHDSREFCASKLGSQTAAGTSHKASLFHAREREREARRHIFPQQQLCDERICGYAGLRTSNWALAICVFPQTRLPTEFCIPFINFLRYIRERKCARACFFVRLPNCSACIEVWGLSTRVSPTIPSSLSRVNVRTGARPHLSTKQQRVSSTFPVEYNQILRVIIITH